jgi:2,4-dienoyl-CoA reductase-like NADH-dependent reductase (Old Yellow Enzyme family)
MSDIDTYDTQIAILNQVAEEMHKKGATQPLQLIHLTAVIQNPQMTSFVHH